MTLRNKSGAIVATRTESMGPGFQIAEDVSARFPEAAGGFEGTVEITPPGYPTGRNKIQATVVRYDNGGSSVFTALPVFTHPEHPNRQSAEVGAGYLPPSGATTLYHPLIADGGSYQTNFILFNPGDAATTATVEFFAANGTPLAIPIAGASRTQFAVSLPPRAVEHVLSAGTGGDISWGWARVTAPAPIRGQAILQTQRDGQITAETAVPMADPMRRFAVVVTNTSTTESGIALGNPNSNEVAATFRLRDAAGTLAGELAVAVPGRGRLAQFVTQLFPGFSEFDGTLEIEATGGLLTGVGLRYDNPGATVFTTTPVFRLP